MKKSPIIPICLGVIASSLTSFSQTTITAMDSADALAQSLIGPGISISNVEYTGNTQASGYFSGGYAAGNDIASGILLTTGLASSAGANANLSESTSASFQGAGDSTLDALIPGYSTYDAAVLSFDFVSEGDSAYFNYSFASEEYIEWVGSSYNDVFGIFVNGANVAMIPDTNTPVAINTISNVSNEEFFNDNSRSAGTPYAFEYDGFTDVFTAEITGLEAGQSYNIMMGIADAGDSYYDSAVFIQSGSFSSSIVNIAPSGAPEPKTMFLVLIAMAGVFHKSRSAFRHS